MGKSDSNLMFLSWSNSFKHFKIVDENRISAAVFLIRAGCDLDSPRRPGPSGTGGDEARDLATPLHLCCQWGIDQVVETLLEHGAAINSKVLFVGNSKYR